MLIDIIIPCFKTKYLRNLLDCLSNQRKHIGQILIGIDNPYCVIDSIVASSGVADCTRVFPNAEQIGPSATVNELMQYVESACVLMLSDDDLLSNDFLKERIPLLDQFEIVSSYPALIDKFGTDITSDFPSPFKLLDESMSSADVGKSLINDANFLCMPGTIMRTSIFREFQYYGENLLGLQDFEFWLWAFGSGKKIKQIDDSKVQYRQHDENLSNMYVERIWTEYGFAIRSALRKLKAKDLSRLYPESLAWMQHNQVDTGVVIAYLMSSHIRPEVRYLAILDLFEFYNRKEFRSMMKANFNITLHVLHRQLSKYSVGDFKT